MKTQTKTEYWIEFLMRSCGDAFAIGPFKSRTVAQALCERWKKGPKGYPDTRVVAKRIATTLAILVLAGMLAQAASLNPPADLVAYVPQGPVGITVLQVCLSWTDTSRNEVGFRVERASYDEMTGDLGPWDTVAMLPRNTTAWIDYEPLWQAWAAYRVVAISRKAEAESNVAFYRLQ